MSVLQKEGFEPVVQAGLTSAHPSLSANSVIVAVSKGSTQMPPSTKYLKTLSSPALLLDHQALSKLRQIVTIPLPAGAEELNV